MVNRTRKAARGLAVVAATAFAVAAPASVQAATITALHCESGSGRYLCDVAVVGPSYAPPVIRWTVNGAPVPAFNNQVAVNGTCWIGRMVAVSVWVGDPLHEQGQPYEQDTESTTLLCRRYWQ
jgi:hypothetical protein